MEAGNLNLFFYFFYFFIFVKIFFLNFFETKNFRKFRKIIFCAEINFLSSRARLKIKSVRNRKVQKIPGFFRAKIENFKKVRSVSGQIWGRRVEAGKSLLFLCKKIFCARQKILKFSHQNIFKKLRKIIFFIFSFFSKNFKNFKKVHGSIIIFFIFFIFSFFLKK